MVRLNQYWTYPVGRESTDAMFEVVLSKDEAQYAITGVTKDEAGNQTYLVIQKINSDLGI